MNFVFKVDAFIIEKHFTLDINRGGPDDSFSLKSIEFSNLYQDVGNAWKAIKSVNYSLKLSEIESIKFRRLQYYVKNMKKGNRITYENIKVLSQSME